MSDWVDATLGDVITLKRGYDLPKRDRLPGPVPIVSSAGETGSHMVAKAEPPGVVTGRYGTLGKVFYVDVPYWPLNTTLYVRDFKGNYERFVACYLESMGLEAYDGAAAVPGLDRNVLHRLPVRWPSLHVQRKIAAVLAAYDELIENNIRRIEILEEIVQAVFREWFVNLRFPGHQEVAVADSPLGPVPGGWTIRRMDEIAVLHRGRSYRTANLVDNGGWPFLNLKCIDRDGGFRRNGLKRYEGPIKPHQLARTGDLVIALTDMTQERRIVARVARVPRLEEPQAAMSMDLLRVAPVEQRDTHFLYGVLRFSSFPDQVKQYANGANVLHLSPDRVAEYELPFPPVDLRERFADVMEPLVELCDNLELQNGSLRTTRDLLLPKLVSGELDVSELDIETGWLAS